MELSALIASKECIVCCFLSFVFIFYFSNVPLLKIMPVLVNSPSYEVAQSFHQPWLCDRSISDGFFSKLIAFSIMVESGISIIESRLGKTNVWFFNISAFFNLYHISLPFSLTCFSLLSVQWIWKPYYDCVMITRTLCHAIFMYLFCVKIQMKIHVVNRHDNFP